MLKRLNKWWSRKQSSTLPVEVQNFVQTMTIGGQEYSLMVAQLNDAVDMFDIEEAAYEGSTPWPLEVFEDEAFMRKHIKCGCQFFTDKPRTECLCRNIY